MFTYTFSAAFHVQLTEGVSLFYALPVVNVVFAVTMLPPAVNTDFTR